MSDRSQPVPVGSGAISPACTVSVSGASDDHMLCRPVNDRSQPVPVDSGAILPAHADLVSESTTSRFLPTSDYRHEHLATGLGVISSPTNLSPTGEISPPHTTLASATTTSQPRPTNDLRSAASVSSSAPNLGSSSLLPTPFSSPAPMLGAERHHTSHSVVRPRPPSADLAPFSSLDLSSLANQSCPSPADLASFPPLGSSS